jgi:hypothetical protein
MEDLVQVLVILAIILFSILSGAGKKKRAQARPPVGRPQPRPAVPQARPVEAASAGDGQTEVMEGLLDLLRGRVPLEVPAPLPEPPPPADEEAVSLEDLEPDMAASHQAFQDKYVTPAQPPPTVPRRVSRYRLTPKTARDAIVWSEIFGKPKGMP